MKQTLRFIRGLASATFRILRDPDQARYFKHWIGSHREGFLLENRLPWISFRARERLEEILVERASIFEWGSGGSTLFWLEKSPDLLVSVEHDEGWFREVQNLVSKRAAELEKTEVRYRHIRSERIHAAEAATTDDGEGERAFSSKAPEYRDHEFHRYVVAISEYPEESLDLIFVDGRARPSCAKWALPHLAPGGWLVIDNSEREYYFDLIGEAVSGWKREDICGYAPSSLAPSQTTFLQKPV